MHCQINVKILHCTSTISKWFAIALELFRSATSFNNILNWWIWPYHFSIRRRLNVRLTLSANNFLSFIVVSCKVGIKNWKKCQMKNISCNKNPALFSLFLSVDCVTLWQQFPHSHRAIRSSSQSNDTRTHTDILFYGASRVKKNAKVWLSYLFVRFSFQFTTFYLKRCISFALLIYPHNVIIILDFMYALRLRQRCLCRSICTGCAVRINRMSWKCGWAINFYWKYLINMCVCLITEHVKRHGFWNWAASMAFEGMWDECSKNAFCWRWENWISKWYWLDKFTHLILRSKCLFFFFKFQNCKGLK